jgi:type III restriction enzyme
MTMEKLKMHSPDLTERNIDKIAELFPSVLTETPGEHGNPDWAIAFRDGKVKHVYFVAETKGSLSTLQLRGVEEAKIECARKFFKSLNEKADTENVTYDLVSTYEELMTKVMV